MTTKPSFLLPLAASLLVVGCETLAPTPVKELDLWKDAAAGVENTTLAQLCIEIWEHRLAEDPFEATYKGDPRYHGEVPDRSQHALRLEREVLEAYLERARSVRTHMLSATDRITHGLLVEELENELTQLDLHFETWVVDPLWGPHIQMLNLTAVQPKTTAGERAALVKRWNGFGTWLRQATDNLAVGLRRGHVSSYTAVAKAVTQLEEILETEPMDSPLVAVALGGGHWVDLPPGSTVAEVAHEHFGDGRRQHELRTLNRHLQDGERLALGTRVLVPAEDDPLSIEARGKFLDGVLRAVEGEIYPALTAYHDLLTQRILPRSRQDLEPGLVHLPKGLEAYRAMIRIHTSLPEDECDPREIHEFGLSEVKRIRSEIAALGERVFGTRDVAAIQKRLRQDPSLFFDTRAEVEAKAVEALSSARARMSRYFGRLPGADCEVVRIAPHEEKDTTIAYYRGPAADGTRPGQYFINTYQPETRPRYEAEVLAYHEAIPGHHLQIAIAQELEDLPLVRRHGGSTAFVEGWALYTERLCDEMGLYESDLDRLGMLSFDAWRASRLVVDTGMHAFGWSRQEAIDFLFTNTLLAENNVENEVDRYIAWPGQALAYKIGQREILALRERAREAQGAGFSYPEFHDRILENGAVTLSVLRGIIERWLAE